MNTPTALPASSPGLPATIEVVASEAGRLDAWIDFNQDGVFDNATEKVFEGNLTVASHDLTFPVPAGAVAGRSSPPGATEPVDAASTIERIVPSDGDDVVRGDVVLALRSPDES